MNLVSSYDPEGTLHVGVRDGDVVIGTGMTADELTRRGSEALPDLRSAAAERRSTAALEGLRLGPPIPHPGKILCVGLNYRQHAAEIGKPIPDYPVLFSKFGNTITSADASVAIPPEVRKLDYEAELAVVIGSHTRRVSVDDALEHVLGYMSCNDLSARALQGRGGQWLLGKTLDDFLPLGPQLVTADEIPDPQTLSVRCWLNGELRQDSNTSDMIFSVAEVISYASTYFALEPGDIICTGTPQGVILGMKEQAWIRPGDETVVEIGDLGRVTTRFVEGG